VTLSPGLNNLTVTAIDENSQVRETLEIPIYRYSGYQTVTGPIVGDETWTEAGGPYLVDENVSIPQGSTLRIEPGTTVFLGSIGGFNVEGGLIAEGTSSAPVRFMPWRCAPWDLIEVQPTAEDVRFAYCEFRDSLARGDGSSTFIATVTIHGASVAIDHCVFRELEKGIEVNTGGSLLYTNSVLMNSRELFHSAACFCIIDHNTFINAIGYADCIDFDGDSVPHSRVTEWIPTTPTC
jgi:hypothetical protein